MAYRIRAFRCWTNARGGAENSYVEPAEYPTREAAEEEIRRRERGPYYRTPGEVGRPVYEVVEVAE
ncbi:MAG: hypothetical protein BWX64_00645 [Acidobacteria bacterium ADurb.Bin051]|jgi:hypothetical protein|nr:MAG: hypothetical protein BWX64_00645 [Acidobacteria bacterium ADurb.Bin051]